MTKIIDSYKMGNVENGADSVVENGKMSGKIWTIIRPITWVVKGEEIVT